MSKFLVTGGAGFIGSHIVETLVRKGNFVRVLDDFSSGNKVNLASVIRRIDLIKGDIRLKETCLKATKGIDFVLHHAALRSVPGSLLDPKRYNDVNILGTLNMLEAALKNKIRCFVFASSSSIYGETKRFPQREDDLPQLISPYALTKLTGEYYCKIFARNHGLNTVSLRYFNVFGPRQSLDDEYAVVIPKFINCILKNERPPVYGSGRQSRDFVYVANIVEANILATQKRNIKGEIFNVASAREHTVLDLVDILNRIAKKKIKPIFLSPRPGDVLRTLADLSKTKDILGFRPKVNFSVGLRLTLEYFNKNG